MLSFLIGQKVVSGTTEISDDSLFGFIFANYTLIVECSWRIRNEKGVLMGEPDLKYSKITYKQIYDVVRNRQVTDVYLNEVTSDLTIEFDKQIYLDLFHNSGMFEAWEIHEHKMNGIFVHTLPGGGVSYYE